MTDAPASPVNVVIPGERAVAEPPPASVNPVVPETPVVAESPGSSVNVVIPEIPVVPDAPAGFPTRAEPDVTRAEIDAPSDSGPRAVSAPGGVGGGLAGGVRGGDRHVSPESDAPAPPVDAGDLMVAAADLVIGTAWWATGPLRAAGRLTYHAVEAGLASATARSRRLQLRAQARRGDARTTIDLLIQALLRPLVKRVVDAALAELDLTKLVLENVDLDEVAAALDVDAVVRRVDVNGIVGQVDLDSAVRRVDMDQIVARIDVNGIVQQVDIDAVVGMVDVDSIVNRLDLNEIARRLDIDGIVARVDLQAIVDRLDIAAVVAGVDPDPVVARVNFDAAMAHIDLIGIAQRVVDGIDLPGIIRESTGSLATEAVAGVRSQGQAADDAVGQLVGRVLRRRALDAPRPQ